MSAIKEIEMEYIPALDEPGSIACVPAELALRHAEQLDAANAEIERLRDELADTVSRPARSEPGKWLRDTTTDERSWHEDSGHENGNYYNTCCHCLRSFFGHKRRVICKVCSTESPPTQVAAKPSEQIPASVSVERPDSPALDGDLTALVLRIKDAVQGRCALDRFQLATIHDAIERLLQRAEAAEGLLHDSQRRRVELEDALGAARRKCDYTQSFLEAEHDAHMECHRKLEAAERDAALFRTLCETHPGELCFRGETYRTADEFRAAIADAMKDRT